LPQKLSEHFSQQFYVEKKPGAGGNIGTGLAAQAPPDGYTLLFTDGTSFVVNPNLYEKLPYDPFKDFQPVSLAVTTTQVLVMHPDLCRNGLAVLLPDVKELLNALGFEPFAPSLEDSVIRIRTESDKWAKLIRGTGLKIG